MWLRGILCGLSLSSLGKQDLDCRNQMWVKGISHGLEGFGVDYIDLVWASGAVLCDVEGSAVCGGGLCCESYGSILF